MPGSDFTVSRAVRLAGVITAIPEAERPEGYTEALEEILGGFRKYRFWPTDAGQDEMIFWSEVRAAFHNTNRHRHRERQRQRQRHQHQHQQHRVHCNAFAYHQLHTTGRTT